MPDHSIFTVGGTVQAGGGIYLPRPADDELLAHCLAGDFCYVLTARQMGKSSLMVRTAERLREQEHRAVIIDLTRLGTTLQAEQWYLGLIDEIVEQLDLEIDYRAWWEKYAHLGATLRLSRFLREELLAALPEPLVIFIDEIDTTLSLPFSDDFFAAIRACYNARSTDPAYKRLSFVLLGVATPGDLIRDSQRTPFNIGTRIDLTDFTVEQALPFAEGFNLPNQQSKIQTLKWVLDWTGGHPYLTQRLCRALLDANRDSWDESVVAEIVEQTFFRERSRQDGNLQFVRDMLTLRAPENYKLTVLQLLRNIHTGRKITDEEQAIPKTHLKLAGIVRRDGDFLALRNKIYARVFDQRWLKENWPTTRRNQLLTIAFAVIFTLCVGASGTFVVQNYGLDLRGYLFHLQTGLAHEASVKPFQDASGTKMVIIPAGTFQMGGDPQVGLAECQKYSNECADISSFLDSAPIHSVDVEEFAMDIFEVTNAQYRACVEAGVCQPPANDRSYIRLRYYNDAFYNNYPVIYVSWEGAKTYCDWRGARLPTEAEWEYAARGGLEGKNYPWGDVFEDGQVNFCDLHCPMGWADKNINDGYPDTSPVGSYPPNGYGLYDVIGNTYEWAYDFYDVYPGGDPNASEFFGQQAHVLRGGSWSNDQASLNVASRFGSSLGYWQNEDDSFGFRCAR